MSDQRLPAEFADLEPFCDRWLQPTEALRNQARIECGMDAIQTFYDAMLPRFEAVIQHLNRMPLRELDELDKNLLTLCFSFIEASGPVERFGTPEVTDLFSSQRFNIHGESANTGH